MGLPVAAYRTEHARTFRSEMMPGVLGRFLLIIIRSVSCSVCGDEEVIYLYSLVLDVSLGWRRREGANKKPFRKLRNNRLSAGCFRGVCRRVDAWTGLSGQVKPPSYSWTGAIRAGISGRAPCHSSIDPLDVGDALRGRQRETDVIL